MTRTIAGPKCRHKRTGIVTAGGAGTGHAATSVCSRTACIVDAIEWASMASGGQPARHIEDPVKVDAFAQGGLWDGGEANREEGDR